MAVAFDAVGPAGGGGAKGTATPLTWAHINSAASNALCVGINYRTGTTSDVTAVTYGGVSLARLGQVPGNNAGPGGIDVWGVIGGLGTGSNTVSVTFGTATADLVTGGSVSMTGATSFGTAFTAFASATSVSVNVTGTTSGNMIFAAGSFGNGSAVFATTSPGTQRWAVIGDSNEAADNTTGGTWASPGGTQAAGFSETGAPSDFWGLVAVEVQGAAAAGGGGGAALPGRTWLRRFHHRQNLPPQPGTVAAAVAVPAPLERPAVTSRPPQRARVGARGMCAAGVAVAFAAATAPPGIHPQPAPAARRVPARAHTGPQGRPGAGLASAVVTPRGIPARPQPFIFRSPLPGRARTGRAGQPGAGIASAVITPMGSPPQPAWRQPVPRRVPDRAQVGPAGRNAAGIASQAVTPMGIPGPPWRPQPRRPAPARGLWRAGAGPQPAAVTVVTSYQHAPPPPRSPAPRRALWRGFASRVVTPMGTPGPAWRPQPRRPAPARALWHGGAGPQPAAAPVVTAYQHAPPPPRSRPPRRALWRGYGSPVVTPMGTPTARRPVFITLGRRSRAAVGHGQVAGGIAGPPAVAPAAPQAYQHPPPQPRRPAPRRALWRGLAVTAPRPAPGPPWRPLPRPAAPRRALWHGGAGPQPVATTAAAPRLPRQPRSAPPRRAVWRGLGSRIITPLGIPSRKPPPPANTPRKRQRALWRRGAGPQPPPPSGLLAGVTAGPPASRWQASLPVPRWLARAAASRWQAGQPAARYDAGNPASRWAAGLPLQGRYSVRVVTGSVEYIPFPVSGPPGVDVTTLPLEVAIVTEAHGEPPPADPAWTAGLWLNGMAAALVDETALGNGDYVVFGRLTASPERPVVRAGRVRLGPAS